MTSATAKDPADRVDELRTTIAKHDHAYYVRDDPEISDADYDALLDELRRLEQENPDLLTPDSPTQRVGGQSLDKFEHVEHAEPMLSLANARSEDDMLAWEKRVRNLLARYDISAEQFGFVTEPKVDGLAISLTYERGELIRGATRGDGRIGEDVTHNLRTIRAIPLRIDDDAELVEVRGEIYYGRAGFEQLNEQRAAAGEHTFANPRNAAAGTIRQLDPSIAAERPLSIWTYGIGARRGVDFETHSAEIDWLREKGFKVDDEIAVHDAIEEVVERCTWWEQRRESLDTEIDGVVV